MMEINVLMTTDKNYISQARVAIWSARKFTDAKTRLIITILCSNDLDQFSRNRLYALEKESNNLLIKFHEIDERDFAEAHVSGHISEAAYYRLMAAEVLEVSKCIYLDCDLIVCLDLNELYEIDISDSYLGGVPDINLILQPNLAFAYMCGYDMKDFSDYINTGVLLMNLDLMRKEHLVEKFRLEIVQRNNVNLWHDQDVINRICHGKIHILDWTFNHITGYSDEEYMWQCGKTKRPGQGEIYHWAGLKKAWYNHSFWQAKMWWEIAKEALEPDEYQKLYHVSDDCMRQVYFLEIAKRCIGQNEIVILGFSDHGMRVMRYLRRCGITGNIIFCDNDKAKREMHLTSNDVLSVEMAVSKYKNAIWINVVQGARDEVNEQMVKLGISNNRILEYHAVDSDYYLFLDTEYMKRGLKEKMYLERGIDE